MDKDHKTKVIFAIIYGIVVIISLLIIYILPVFLPIALTVVVFVCQKELYQMFERKQMRLNKGLGILASIIFIWLIYYQIDEIALFLFGVIFLIPLILFLQKRQLPPITSFSLLLFGIIYIGLLSSFFIKVYQEFTFFYLLFFIILTWANDIGSYVVGNTLKGPKLLPIISPNKTISGAIGGIIFCLIAAFILVKIGTGLGGGYQKIVTPLDTILVAIVVSIGAQVGDLYESWLKRICGVKDTADLIPAHGGLLDRLDSLLFTAPLTYYYLVFL